MGLPSTVVLSTLEFDVLWEAQRFPRRHVVLDVPSPGVTTNQRADLVRTAWVALTERGLADRGRAEPELADRLALLAYPERSVDGWIWTDREIRGLAAQAGRQAMLGVVDRDEVWLIPARDSSFVEAAVSMAGECPGGYGRSINLPQDTLHAADLAADGDPKALIVQLEERDVPLGQAQILARMFAGITGRGQFGAERTVSGRNTRRANRVVAFHDTDSGRYLYLTRPSADGRIWATVTPSDNRGIANSVWELLDEA
ncbi:MAG TPA: ESX secretion-associated protein EspG [Pseudonocardiaceae bacterium]|nr:ESX secretion-associated protein EspG [Pseudonocardiaceae bacterium]